MSTQNDPTLEELADILQETRRLFEWPAVDDRGFFWFINSYSWDGHEQIGRRIGDQVQHGSQVNIDYVG